MKHIHLRTARERQRMTQEQLEAASGVPQTTISRLETHDDVRVSLDIAAKLAESLGLSDPRELRFGPAPTRKSKTQEEQVEA